jgi:TolA-binding protein
MRFTSSVVLGAALVFGCEGSQRPAFTEAPAATVTVAPPVASADRPGEIDGGEDSNGLPLADTGMGGDVGSSLSPPIATAPVLSSPPRSILAARDPRAAARRPRANALLVTELMGLTSLLRTTPGNSPGRPHLIRQIAEDYAELERSAIAAPPFGMAPTTVSPGNSPLARNARTQAIAHYTLLESVPTYPQLDEALYYKGLEHELEGDLTKARRAYFDVIRKAPTSKFVPFAHFAFGEMFFDEAVGDPAKNDLALQAYNEVLKLPANPLGAESLLRSAQIAERKGDRARALTVYRKLLQTHPRTNAALSVPAWARGP